MITKNDAKCEDNHQSFYHMKNGLLALKIYKYVQMILFLLCRGYF